MENNNAPDADSILEECLKDWGERDSSYYVTEDEITSLISAGALIKENHVPGDGTQIITVEYKGKTFACSTVNKKLIALLSQ